MPGSGYQKNRNDSNWDCLAGVNQPQARKKSSTIKVVRTNLLGASQNDITVNDVEADITQGGGIGDHQVGFEQSIAATTDNQPLTADQMFALNMLKASDI